jgi:flagellar biogenesis protein FliO
MNLRGAMWTVCLAVWLLCAGSGADTGMEPLPGKPFKHDANLTALAGEWNAPDSLPETREEMESEPPPPSGESTTTAPDPAALAVHTPEAAIEESAPAPLSEPPSPQLLRLQETYQTADLPLAWSPEEPREQPDLVQLALRATMWLLAICAGIILLGLLLKKIGRRTPLLAGPQLGQVLGRVHLTPKAALHFVRSGGRVLVLGVTPGGISLVSEYDADAFDRASQPADQPRRPSPERKPFEERLRENVARMDGAVPLQEDDDIAALRGDIERLRGHLRETTRDPRDA